MPFFFDAAILSRMRSPVTSRSNWANDNSTLSVSRPIELVVLNCCVTETNDTASASKSSTSRAKSASESRQSVDLVDHDDIDPACPDIGKQTLQRWSLQIAAGEPAVMIAGSRPHPALVLLAANVGLAGFALRRKRVEFLLQALLGGFAGVDRAAPAAGVTARHLRSPSPRLGTAVGTTVGRQAGSASARRTAVPTMVCQ